MISRYTHTYIINLFNSYNSMGLCTTIAVIYRGGIKKSLQIHTASKWQRYELNLNSLAPEFEFLACTLYCFSKVLQIVFSFNFLFSIMGTVSFLHMLCFQQRQLLVTDKIRPFST